MDDDEALLNEQNGLTPGQQQLRPRSNKHLPPTFGGDLHEDPVDWMELFEGHAVLNNWDDRDKYRSFFMFLRKPARYWFKSLMSRAEAPVAWEGLKNQFLLHYRPADYLHSLTEKLNNRYQEPGESLQGYYNEIIGLCDQIDPRMSEDDKLRHIFRGLDKRAYEVLYPAVCATGYTADNFYHQVMRYQNRQPKGHKRLFEDQQGVASTSSCFLVNSIKSAEPPAKKQIVEDKDKFVTKQELKAFLEETVKSVTEALKSGATAESPVVNANRSHATQNRAVNFERRKWPRTDDGRPICMRCNKPGHIARYCKSRLPSKEGSPSPRPSSTDSKRDDVSPSKRTEREQSKN